MSEINSPTIIGFHANYTDECKRFMEDESFLIISSDTDYLGKGMYFWEHKSNARYWKRAKKNNKQSSIVSALIDLENMLDLTDDDVLEILEKCCNKIKKVCNTHKLGEKINYILEIGNFPHDIDVVRCREHKKNKKENSFLRDTNVTAKSIDIYCVKVVDAIKQRKWVEQ